MNLPPPGPPIPDHSLPVQCPGFADEDPRHALITRALLAEWHQRIENQTVASPEEHCAAMATAVITALDPKGR
ncbi:hypothetical protein ACIP2X_18995 [Streptomyces sp. NPDC089424]|uniref:hypothetical protein n=1 Tax=Streptomyces sp. NPDC089424 TaxID=3365917 RepID=UPI00381CA8D3